MASRVQTCKSKDLIHPPKWLPDNVHYEVITGSVSYGASSDTSDMDIVGFCIPPKEFIFPHLAGEIEGFGTQKKRFHQWQEHHVKDQKQEYDFTIYSIVKFFQLVMENNPNMVDSLYVPQRCVLYCSSIAQMVRDRRQIFLHKGSYHKFRGYAYASLGKLNNRSKAMETEEKTPSNIKKMLEKIDSTDLNLLEQEKKLRGLS